jgi:hypothetical protein
MAAKTAALARASMAKASITPSTSPMPHKRPVARKPAEEKTDPKMWNRAQAIFALAAIEHCYFSSARAPDMSAAYPRLMARIE